MAGTGPNNRDLCYRQNEDDPHEVGSDPGCPCWEGVKSLGQILAEESMGRLDPSDPFDKVIINMVSMNRKKRRDYAADSDPFSNFRDTARNMALDGFGPAEAAYALLLTKISRLRSLRANGRMEDTANESVLDTYLDLAVYSVILLALVKEQANGTNPNQ